MLALDLFLDPGSVSTVQVPAMATLPQSSDVRKRVISKPLRRWVAGWLCVPCLPACLATRGAPSLLHICSAFVALACPPPTTTEHPADAACSAPVLLPAG